MAKRLQREIMAAEEESSVKRVTQHGFLVSAIVSRLISVFDRHSASLVSKLWNDTVVSETHTVSVRSRSLLPLFFSRFSHAEILNFRPCFDQLRDEDLLTAASAFPLLHTLIVGRSTLPQEKLTDDGLSGFVKISSRLRQVTLCCVANLHDAGICAFTRHCRDLTTLSLSSCRNLTDHALDGLSNCESLKELKLKGDFLFTPSGLARVGENCRGLVTVGLEFETLDISLPLRSLAVNCEKLETLTLKYRHGDLGELSRCCSLVRLHVEADNTNNVDVSIINVALANRKLKEFSYVNLSVALGDSAAVAVMHNCPDLERFSLEASKLSESSVLCMNHCKSLNSITLNHFHSGGRSLSLMGQFGVPLKEINGIFGRGIWDFSFGQGIWDVELEKFIRSNKQLVYINMQCILGPSPTAFSAIAVCSNLRHLDLSFTDVDNISLAAIANNTTALRHLSLVNCEVVSDMKVLSNFKGLEYLNLNQCRFVNDEGLDFLAVGFSKLTYLSLASTRITDIGLSYLARCSRLRTLKIPDCGGVQGSGLVTVAKCCSWLRYLVISHSFWNSEVLAELKKQYCMVRLVKHTQN
jgi:hypothetical protein